MPKVKIARRVFVRLDDLPMLLESTPCPACLFLKKEPGRPSIWEIQWRENGRRRKRSTVATSRRDADRALKEFATAIKPDLQSRPLDEIKLGDVLDQYASNVANKVHEPARIGYAIQNLAQFWGDLSPLDVIERNCIAYAKSRIVGCDGRQAAAGTIRRELGVLRAALNHMPPNVLLIKPRIVMPPKPEAKADWLDRRQIAAMISAARADPKTRVHLPIFIVLGFCSGGRKAALLTLEWRPNPRGGHIDLKSGWIHMNPVGRKQTKKPRATIRTPPQLNVILRGLSKRGHQTVIARNDGAPIKNVRRGFAAAANAAGAPWATPHTLRHTCITHMLLNGVGHYDVSKWATISLGELENTYGHRDPEYLAGPVLAWHQDRRADHG